MSWLRLADVAVAAIALALAGCHDQETVSPLDAGASDAGPDDAGPPVDAGPVIRTVELRSPFGAAPKNLLADGDFEWSVSGGSGSQFAWLSFDASGTGGVATRIETGGLCRSGLRCAVIDVHTVMLLRGASAPDLRAMVGSIAIKPAAGATCGSVRVIALPCDTLGAPQQVLPATPAVGPDGYCLAKGTIPGSALATCFYIDAAGLGGKTALLDDAKLEPVETDTSPIAAVKFQPEPELEARLARLREHLRRRMPVGRPLAHPRVPSP